MNKDIDDSTLVATLIVGQLRELLNTKPSYTATPPQFCSDIMTVKDVAELTGYSRATLYKLTSEKKIPFHKPAHNGRKTIFSRAEIEDWLKANKVITDDEYFNQHTIKLCQTSKKQQK